MKCRTRQPEGGGVPTAVFLHAMSCTSYLRDKLWLYERTRLGTRLTIVTQFENVAIPSCFTHASSAKSLARI